MIWYDIWYRVSACTTQARIVVMKPWSAESGANSVISLIQVLRDWWLLVQVLSIKQDDVLKTSPTGWRYRSAGDPVEWWLHFKEQALCLSVCMSQPAAAACTTCHHRHHHHCHCRHYYKTWYWRPKLPIQLRRVLDAKRSDCLDRNDRSGNTCYMAIEM